MSRGSPERLAPSGEAAGHLRMRAVLQAEYGDADVFGITDTARPAIEDHEVLVEVRAAGMDPGRGT